jgi:DNA uptake protein ComE-like DNA-binding protein
MRKAALSEITFRFAATLGLCAALLWIVSCTATGKPESDQRIQQQARQATENAKVAAQKAAAEARIAAANAEREANDVAKGVRAGLHNGKGNDRAVDLNSASRADLETLPGVTATTARRITANRPYDTPHDLVSKGVVSQSEFDRIAGAVVTH